MFTGYNGLWGLLILAGDIWAIINILQSSADNGTKLDLGTRGATAAATRSDSVVFHRSEGP